MPWITELHPCAEWHCVCSAFIACPGVAFAGTDTPSSRRIWSIGLRETNTACPANGFVPLKFAESITFNWARVPVGAADMPAPASEFANAVEPAPALGGGGVEAGAAAAPSAGAYAGAVGAAAFDLAIGAGAFDASIVFCAPLGAKLPTLQFSECGVKLTF